MNSRTSVLVLALWAFSTVAAFTGCGSSETPEASSQSGASKSTSSTPTAQIDSAPTSSSHTAISKSTPDDFDFTTGPYPSVQKSAEKRPVVDPFPRLRVQTSLGSFVIELDREKAPQTVDNFLINYVGRSFYVETCFHYVEQDFMIAAGGFTADLEAKETRASIRNESRNGLKNVRGAIAMARHPEYPHSATSQFFINLVDNPSLDHQQLTQVSAEESNQTREELEAEDDSYQPNGYCVFGKVVEGMDVVDRIAQTPVSDKPDFPRVPNEPVVIQSVERIN